MSLSFCVFYVSIKDGRKRETAGEFEQEVEKRKYVLFQW
jgi:hypothetical protein